MERQVSNFLDKSFIPFISAVCSFIIWGNTTLQAQNIENYQKGKLYTIDTIIVSGIKTFSNQTVISYSQLREGQKINIPGDEISDVIKKLWNLQLFSDINFYINKIDGDSVALEIEIEELPSLSEVKINGLKKSKIQPLITDTELKAGKKLSESFLANTKNYIINKFQKEGFLNTKVAFNTVEDTINKNTYMMVVNAVSYTHLTLPTIYSV